MLNSIQGVSSMYGTGSLQAPQSLSADQKSTVQSILSQYDPKNVTTADAKSIFKSLREAGIQPSSDLRGMLTSAGFDPEQLRSLAGAGGHHHGGHHGGGKSSATSSSSGIDPAALQQLQSILDQYDTTSLSSDQQNNLITQLGDAGLMDQSGSMINLSA